MKVFKSLLKTILSGIIALLILSIIMLGYYYIPLRQNNSKNNTDYVWSTNTYWADLTEGISYGVIDANGYNNKEVIDNPDILFLGSSHTESMNVMQSENMCSLLDDEFGGKYRAYNMGISGHTFYKVTQYLKNSLDTFEKKPKYVIIETSSVSLSETEVQNALSGNVLKTKVVDRGILAKMQKVPYFRQMYHQLDGGMLKMLLPNDKKKTENTAAPSSENAPAKVTIDTKPYDEMLGYLQKIEKEYDTQIIVMFHPFESIHADGTVSFSEGEYTKVFSQYAHKYEIGFVDMTEDFEKMYYEEHHVPHGFATGELGVGHINKYGHAAIANRLCQYINELEEK